MKHLFLFFLASVVFCFSLSGQNAYITQSLQNEITPPKGMPLAKQKNSVSENFIRINIVFYNQLNAEEIKAQMDELHLPAKERPLVVMNELKKIAEASRQEMEPIFRKAKTDWANKEEFWLVNMIVVDASPSLISELSRSPLIDYIDLDQANLVKPIKPVQEKLEREKSVGGIEPGLQVINAPALWAMGYTGRGKIAFTLDTGIWPTHPAFRDHFIGYRKSMKQGWLGFDSQLPTDKGNAHGTHVTGTMLGLDPATSDTIGAAFNAYFMVSDPVATSLATAKPISAFVAAFQWAFNPDGDTNTTDDIPDVINNSWGFDIAKDTLLCVSFVSQMFNALESAGIPAIFSAGNEGPADTTISIPHHINTGLVNSFAVGSINPHDTTYPISTFSSRGPSVCPATGSLAIKPEVSAPGQQIRSAVANNGYDVYSGTSMASPHVSGAVLLLREAFPTLTGEEILLALYYSAHDLGAPGEDNTYGRGLIDVLAAYNYLAQTHTPAPPVSNQFDLKITEVLAPTQTFICDTLITPVVRLENLGVTNIPVAAITCQVNGTSYVSQILSALAPGQTQDFTLQQIAIPTGDVELIFHAESYVSVLEADYMNNYLSTRLNVRQRTALPIFEDFEFNSLHSNGWYAENPDVIRGWTIDTTGGLFGFRSAKMPCFNYSPKASQLDDLLTPIFTMPTSGKVTMIFDYAYQLRLAQIADTLKIYVVDACSLTNNTLVWEKGGLALETFDSIPSDFVPLLPHHWKTDTIDLSAFANGGEIMIDFQTTNRMGNNIYLDNIRIYQGNTPPVTIEELKPQNIKIYPNPTEDLIWIESTELFNNLQLTLSDISGKVLIEERIASDKGKLSKISLESLKSGIYILKITNGEEVSYFKILKR